MSYVKRVLFLKVFRSLKSSHDGSVNTPEMQTWGKGQEIPNYFIVHFFYRAEQGLLEKNQVIGMHVYSRGWGKHNNKYANILPLSLSHPTSPAPVPCFPTILEHSGSCKYITQTPLFRVFAFVMPSASNHFSPDTWLCIIRSLLRYHRLREASPRVLLNPLLHPTPHSSTTPCFIGLTVLENYLFCVCVYPLPNEV